MSCYRFNTTLYRGFANQETGTEIYKDFNRIIEENGISPSEVSILFNRFIHSDRHREEVYSRLAGDNKPESLASIQSIEREFVRFFNELIQPKEGVEMSVLEDVFKLDEDTLSRTLSNKDSLYELASQIGLTEDEISVIDGIESVSSKISGNTKTVTVSFVIQPQSTDQESGAKEISENRTIPIKRVIKMNLTDEASRAFIFKGRKSIRNSSFVSNMVIATGRLGQIDFEEMRGISSGPVIVSQSKLNLTTVKGGASGITNSNVGQTVIGASQDQKIAMAIGTDVDTAIRDLLSNSRRSQPYQRSNYDSAPYRNLSWEAYQDVVSTVENMKATWDKRFGVGSYTIISEKLKFKTSYRKDGKTKVTWMEPDIIIVDKDGNIHIYDIKTSSSNQPHQESQSKWRQQIAMYASALKGLTGGKIENISADVILIKVDYNKNHYKAEKTEDGSYEIMPSEAGRRAGVQEGERISLGVSMGNSELFASSYSNPISSELLKDMIKELSESVSDVELIKNDAIREGIEARRKTYLAALYGAQEVEKMEKSEKSKAYDKGLTDSIINRAIDSVVKTLSHRVSEGIRSINNGGGGTQNNTELNDLLKKIKEESPKRFSRGRIFSKEMLPRLMSAVINDLIGEASVMTRTDDVTSALYDYLKNPESLEEIMLRAASKMKMLEGISIGGEYGTASDGNTDSIETSKDQVESWQIEAKKVPIDDRLSQEVKRIIETTRVMNTWVEIDGNGNPIIMVNENNPFAINDLGLPEYIDSATAKRTLVDWAQDSENFDDFMNTLLNKAKSFQWAASLYKRLETLSETEKSQFYSNINMVFQEYTAVVASANGGVRLISLNNQNSVDRYRRKVIKNIRTNPPGFALSDMDSQNSLGEGKYNADRISDEIDRSISFIKKMINKDLVGNIDENVAKREVRAIFDRLGMKFDDGLIDAVVSDIMTGRTSTDTESSDRWSNVITSLYWIKKTLVDKNGYSGYLSSKIKAENKNAQVRIIPLSDISSIRELEMIGYQMRHIESESGEEDYVYWDNGRSGSEQIVVLTPSISMRFNNILESVLNYAERTEEGSFRHNGEIRQSYQDPSHATRIARKLGNKKGLSSDEYKESVEDEFLKFDSFARRDNKSDRVSGRGGITFNNDIIRVLYNNNGKFSDGISMGHRSQLAFGESEFVDLSQNQYIGGAIAEYFSDGNPNSTSAWYSIGVLSNKPSNEFMTGVRYRITTSENGLELVYNSSEDAIIKSYEDVVRHESMRIRTVLSRISEATKDSRIKNWDFTESDIEALYKAGVLIKDDKSPSKYRAKDQISLTDLQNIIRVGKGGKFHFLSPVNDFLMSMDSNTVDGSSGLAWYILSIVNQNMDTTSPMIEVSRTEIASIVSNIASERMQQIEDSGLFYGELKEQEDGSPEYRYSFLPDNLRRRGRSYQSLYNEAIDDGATHEEATEYAINRIDDYMKKRVFEFLVNDWINNAMITQILTTDLAYYKNAEEYQKRAAQYHSPGKKMNTSARYEANHAYGGELVSDGKSRAIIVKDLEIGSSIKTNLSVALEQSRARYIESIKGDPNMNELILAYDAHIQGIMKMYDNINTTDGQAFSSPTSYRKKAMMSPGGWSNEQEAIYQEYLEAKREGRSMNLAKIRALMQPIKPFVSTYLEKDGASAGLRKIKVQTQYKNSEHALFVFSAIIGTSQTGGYLKDLVDFMESTHFDENGNYKQDGIDTIQFESAVKVGLSGSIDIHNNDGAPGSIRRMLEDKTRSYAPGRSYNDEVVHTFNYSDYLIQQSTPEHFNDDLQLIGSQLRMLAMAGFAPTDIVPVEVYEEVVGRDGTKSRRRSIERREAKDVISRYESLHAQNIRESIDELIRDLGFPIGEDYTNDGYGEKLLKYKQNLSKALIQQILNDSHIDIDLLEQVKLNQNGDFNVPLSDPTISRKVMNLMYAMVTSRVTKQRISGGTLIQVSSYGYNDSLSIRFKDKEGKTILTEDEFNSLSPEERLDKGITQDSYVEYVQDLQDSVDHYEAFMAFPSDELERVMTKPDGSIISVDEALSRGIITEDMLKMVSYRIPTESKYSMLPIKVKGFLPRAGGEVVILPRELTLITGSDFDIDKMYTMTKEYIIKDDYVVDLGSIDKFMDAIASDDVFLAKVRRAFPRNTPTQEGIMKYIKVALLKNYKVSDPNYEYLVESMKVTDRLMDMVLDKFKPFSEENRVSRVTLPSPNTRGGRNNEILDLTYALISSQRGFEEMSNPGSFEPQKRISKIVSIAMNGLTKPDGTPYTLEDLRSMSTSDLISMSETSSKTDLTSVFDRSLAFRRNMIADKLIGIFANNNVAHAAMQRLNIKMRMPLVVNNGKSSRLVININRNVISEGNGNNIDSILSKDGFITILKNIAGFLAAAVDGAKDPILEAMNIMPETAGMLMVLIRLGVSVEDAGLIFAQPVFKKVLTQLADMKSIGESVSMEELIRESIETLIEAKLRSNGQEVSRKDVKSATTKFLNGRVLTINENDLLFSRIYEESMNGESEPSDKTIDGDLAILRLMSILSSKAKHLNITTTIAKFNSVSNKLGPTKADATKLLSKIPEFQGMMKDDKSAPFSLEANEILELPIQKAFMEGYELLDRAMFKDVMFYDSPAFQFIIDSMASSINPSMVSAELLADLYSAFMLFYVGTTKLDKNGNPDKNSPMALTPDAYKYYSSTEDSFRDSKGIETESFYSKMKRATERHNGTNGLLNEIRADFVESRGEYFVKFSAEGLSKSKEDEDKIKQGWRELLESDNEEDRLLALDLFRLSIMRNGLKLSSSGWFQYAGLDVKRMIPNYLSVLGSSSRFDAVTTNDQAKVLNTQYALRFLDQFIRNNSHGGGMVKRFYIRNGSSTTVKQTGIEGRIEITGKKEAADIRSIITKDLSKELSYIEYDGSLYRSVRYLNTDRKVETRGGLITVVYEKVSPLGIRYGLSEYNPVEDIVKSSLGNKTSRDLESDEEIENRESPYVIDQDYVTDDEEDLIAITNIEQDELDRLVSEIQDATGHRSADIYNAIRESMSDALVRQGEAEDSSEDIFSISRLARGMTESLGTEGDVDTQAKIARILESANQIIEEENICN